MALTDEGNGVGTTMLVQPTLTHLHKIKTLLRLIAIVNLLVRLMVWNKKNSFL